MIYPADLAELMAADDFLSLSQAMQDLMSLPQSLCKSNGGCCRFSVFKGFLSHDELLALASRDLNGDDAADVHNAREFLALFEPCDEQQAASENDQEFERRLRAAKPDKEKITFYKCRFLSTENRCRIHEDRPTGCRAYPFPHDRTIYHPGCGYEENG